MTSHEFAQKLLALPDLPVKVKMEVFDPYGPYYQHRDLYTVETGKIGFPAVASIILDTI